MNWAEDLPGDLLNLVLSNLFGKDRLSFSLVCRHWNAVAATSPYRYSPCLMYYRPRTRTWKFYQYDTFLDMSFPELENAEIRCSKHGWLLMSRFDDTLFFFDPSNNRKVELPGKVPHGYASLCFFNPPTSPECVVVGIQKVFPGRTIRLCILERGEDDDWESEGGEGDDWENEGGEDDDWENEGGEDDDWENEGGEDDDWENEGGEDDDWESEGGEDDDWEDDWEIMVCHTTTDFQVSLGGPVLHCGLIYILSESGDVAIIDIKKWRFDVKLKCLGPEINDINTKEQYLFKVNGEEALFAVFVFEDERKAQVFRLSSEMKWDLMEEGIGDKVLYLSHFSSFGDKARTKSMENTIYFPKFHGEVAAFYSLSDAKYRSLDGDYFEGNAYGLKGFDLAVWIMPLPAQGDSTTSLSWWL